MERSSRPGEQGQKTISIVVPVYFNELNLPDTIPQLLALESKFDGYRLELVFVDDDSRDNPWKFY